MAAMSGAPQPDAADSAPAPSILSRLAEVRGGTALVAAAPALAVTGVGGIAFLARSLAWSPAATVDAWAYAAWGQALARGERPLFDLGWTTPKPLAAALGLLVVPLPPARAFAIVVALAFGVVAGALFAAAYRREGMLAAVAAVAAFLFSTRLNIALALAYADVVVAALVMVGVAARGRLRLGALVLAGLLRPEAWIVAAVAGFEETTGRLRRRVIAALAAAVAAPVLWVLADLVLTGDPLGSWHWQAEHVGGSERETRPWTDLPGAFWDALTREGALWLVVVGLVGLVIHALRSHRRGRLDVVPLAVAASWSVLPVFQFRYGANLHPRYLLPVVAVLALGTGFAAAEIGRRLPRPRSPWPAAAMASGVIVVAVLLLGTTVSMEREMSRNRAIEATRPVVETVLSCGRFGTTKRTARRGVIPQLAAASRRSMYEFGVFRPERPFAAVLHFARGRGPANPPLPPWRRIETPLGPLAVAPGCRALG
jgi:hypothetical protein